jgi:CubicO group peptidase (beta-lactamase class C family)
VQGNRGFVLRRNLIFILTPLVLVAIVLLGVDSMASGTGTPPPSPQSTPSSTSARPTTTTTATQPADADPIGSGTAAGAVQAAEATAVSGEKLGVAVLDRVSGKETDGTAADTTFPCASVLKLFLITDLFHQQEQGTIKLSSTDLTEINSALTISDDSAMDALWVKYHGATAITQLIGIAHLPDAQLTSIAQSGKWGGVLISARDVLTVYEYVLTKLTPADRDLIINTLNKANPVGYQGWNQAFGLLNPVTRTSTTKAKQGWSGWYGQTVLHTTGILDGQDDVVVAILSSRPGTGSDAQFDVARQQVDDATTALIKHLGPNATR